MSENPMEKRNGEPENRPENVSSPEVSDETSVVPSDGEEALTADAADTAGEEDADELTVRIAKECYEWVEVFVLTMAAVLLAFTFLLRPSYVVGSSMNRTLWDRDALIVSNLFYTPKYGDIVVFQQPDSIQTAGEAVVKRVIATEGQTVDIDFDTWQVTVDGKVLYEPYVNFIPNVSMRSYDLQFPLTVPEGCVFLMGDNRNHSLDSRSSDIGCVDTRFIFGRVLFRVFPFNSIGKVD